MIKKIITILTCVVMSLAVLTACSGDSYGKIKIEGEQDYSYSVSSNGGNAVVYGNYIYFINGNSGYDDTDAKNNVFGDVVKGGLYRAELNGEKSDGKFVVKTNDDSINKIKFKSTKGINYKDEEIDVVNVECIVPKRIGTSGYSGGGIFIFDEYVYYASPNNQKNKKGDVQSTKTDFFRTKLDGSKTQLLYTTQNDSNSSPYMFYSFGDKMYIVVKDGSDIISVVVDKKNGKILDTLKIAENVVDVVLPNKPTYDKNTNTNGMEDFVYFTRQEDLGMVAEFMRPDGSERTIWITKDPDLKLEGANDGLLFYRTKTSMGNTIIKATNLHEQFLAVNDDGKVNSPTYKAYQETLSEKDKTQKFDKDVFKNANIDSFSSIYLFKPDSIKDSDAVYVLAASETEVKLFTSPTESKTIYNGKATIENVNIQSGNVYLLSETKLVAVPMYDQDPQPITLTENYTANGLKTDIVAGHVVYMSKSDNFADGYTYFYDENGLEGNDNSFFVGEKIEKDITPKTNSIEIVTNPTKVTYNKGDKLDLTGLQVKATLANGETKTLNADDLKDSVTGYDAKKVGEQTLTITYDSRTVTYTVTVNAKGGCSGAITALTNQMGIPFMFLALVSGLVALVFIMRKKSK